MTTRLERYLTFVNTQIARNSGDKLSERLRLSDLHTERLEDEVRLNTEYCARICRSKLKDPWNELVEQHIQAGIAHARQDWQGAFNYQLSMTKTLLRLLSTCNRWILPVLYTVLRDLRYIAYKADKSDNQTNKSPRLEEAARTINQAFSLCVMDRSSTMNMSRKWGTYFVINLLFGIYFKLGSQNLCKNILRAMTASASDLPALHQYPKSHQAGYKYYLGLLAFREEKYLKAETDLAEAFRICQKNAIQQKERILKFLIPIRLLRGILPSRDLLKRYSRISLAYTPFIEAIRTGDVKSYDKMLFDREQLLARMGTYLTVERARYIAVRTLFRKVFVINGKDTKIPMEKFRIALRLVNIPHDMDEIECLLANMIYKGYLRGYLSHERGYLVLSNKDPFPALTTLSS
ncbi:COP9 signalosome complex subunit 12 [Syncephalis fuscata]|nr:COP9 signalosome complex subunit 12 [Syncephalis fuscata]